MTGNVDPWRQRGGSRFGAKMGRASSVWSEAPPAPHVVLISRVDLVEGYDDGGAYWGEPSDLWCAWTDSAEFAVFFRAPDEREAIAFACNRLPATTLVEGRH